MAIRNHEQSGIQSVCSTQRRRSNRQNSHAAKIQLAQKMIHKAYLELCTAYRLPMVAEGEKIGWEMLARIALTKEKIKDCHSRSKASIDAVTNDLVGHEPSDRYDSDSSGL